MINNLIFEDIARVKLGLNLNEFSEKKVLITGGAGFIGSWLCDVLLDLNSIVTAVDDLSTGRIRNINHLVKNPKFKFIESDVSTFESKDRFDFILHLAGHASPEEYQTKPIETLQVSALGSSKMAELARKNDATILFASTSEVYGDAEIIPTPESYWGKVNPIGPRSCYDEGKRFAEALFIAYNKQYGLDVKIPRIFNTYGPRLREDGLYGRALSRFIQQAQTDSPITIYSDGKQTRSFCYITDTASGLILLLTNKEAIGKVVNVGNDQEITILHLANRIKEITKSESKLTFHPLPEDDPKRRCPEIDRIKELTGWVPRIKIEEGLKRTITWFTQNNHIKP